MKRYEQSIRVITAFFAVLLGFGLKKLLDAEKFYPANAQWPCFLMSVFLFLRFLLGSNNHMWVEFVSGDLKANSHFEVSRKQVLSDFLFLIVFGLIGVAICYSVTLEQFLMLNLVLTATAFAWVIFHVLSGAGNRSDWTHWVCVNLAQALSILVVHFILIPCQWGAIPYWPFPGPAWDWSVSLLVLVYLFVLGWDFSQQLKTLEDLKESPG